MIDEQTLRLAYKGTCEESRVTLDGGLDDEKGEKLNVVYSLLSRLPDHGSNFNALLMSSDGGVQDFFVVYVFGNYYVLVERFFRSRIDWAFNDVRGLADWLNNQERKIFETAALLPHNAANQPTELRRPFLCKMGAQRPHKNGRSSLGRLHWPC